MRPILKWTTLSLFAYVGVAAVAHVPWGEALQALFIPQIEWTAAYATGFVAILGTTISPYLFFWQAGQEIEEERRTSREALCVAPERRWSGTEANPHRHADRHGVQHLGRRLAIVFATAATLHAHGITKIETSAQAAEALRPSPDDLPSLLFAIGIIGQGCLPCRCLQVPPLMR